MTLLICLANSWKHGDKCIAGINPKNGAWIRPVSQLPDGRITKEMRLINAIEPALLEILDIPLAMTGPDFGFEKENLLVLPGAWKKVGKIKPIELFNHCSQSPYILHNNLRYVTLNYMQSLPFPQRHTLQLVKVVEIIPKSKGERFAGIEKWEGKIITNQGQELTATITDPVFNKKLDLGYRPQNHCFVTVSLSMPYRPTDWEDEADPCWKLIAGVIELPSEIRFSNDENNDIGF